MDYNGPRRRKRNIGRRNQRGGANLDFNSIATQLLDRFAVTNKNRPLLLELVESFLREAYGEHLEAIVGFNEPDETPQTLYYDQIASFTSIDEIAAKLINLIRIMSAPVEDIVGCVTTETGEEDDAMISEANEIIANSLFGMYQQQVQQ